MLEAILSGIQRIVPRVEFAAIDPTVLSALSAILVSELCLMPVGGRYWYFSVILQCILAVTISFADFQTACGSAQVEGRRGLAHHRPAVFQLNDNHRMLLKFQLPTSNIIILFGEQSKLLGAQHQKTFQRMGSFYRYRDDKFPRQTIMQGSVILEPHQASEALGG